MIAPRIPPHALRTNCCKLALVIAALIGSCASRSAMAQDCTPQGPPRILVLRGVFEIFSLGMNDLAEKLRCRGYDATSTSWSLALFSMDCSGDRPLIVIGHSLGGRMCGWTSRLMKSCGHRVPLLIVVDANLLTSIPSNVDECLNLYVTNNFGIFHGSPVYAESPETHIVNWDVSRGQPSMFLGGVNHFDIDATDWVHNIIIREIECRFPLCLAVEGDVGEPLAASDLKRSSESSPRSTSATSSSNTDSVAVTIETGIEMDAQEIGKANADPSQEVEQIRTAEAPQMHVLRHDAEDPFEVHARKYKRVQWQPTRPTRAEIENAGGATEHVERVNWQPTVPSPSEGASSAKGTVRTARIPWQPTRPQK
jgi:hypothetical protein